MKVYLMYVGGDWPWRVERDGRYWDFPNREAAQAWKRKLL